MALLIRSTGFYGFTAVADSCHSSLTDADLLTGRSASRLKAFGTFRLRRLIGTAGDLPHALSRKECVIRLADTNLVAVISANSVTTHTICALGLSHSVIAAFDDMFALSAYPRESRRTDTHLLTLLLAVVTSSETTLTLQLDRLLGRTFQNLFAAVVYSSKSGFTSTDLLAEPILFRLPLEWEVALASSVTNCLANFVRRTISDLVAFSIQRDEIWLAHAHLTTFFVAVFIVAAKASVTFGLNNCILSAAYDRDADVVDPCESLLTDTYLFAGRSGWTLDLGCLRCQALLNGKALLVH